MIHWVHYTHVGVGLNPTLSEALSKIAKISFLIEETLVNAEVSCTSPRSVFYWPENLILLTNKLVYRSVENKKWSLENKKWLPLKLEATDHNWFPIASLYSIRTKKRREKSNKVIFWRIFGGKVIVVPGERTIRKMRWSALK